MQMACKTVMEHVLCKPLGPPYQFQILPTHRSPPHSLEPSPCLSAGSHPSESIMSGSICNNQPKIDYIIGLMTNSSHFSGASSFMSPLFRKGGGGFCKARDRPDPCLCRDI